MQDITPNPSYRAQDAGQPVIHHKDKTLLKVLGVVIVIALVILGVYSYQQRHRTAPGTTLDSLEQVSEPVTLTKEEQVAQMEKLEAENKSDVTITERADMLNALQ